MRLMFVPAKYSLLLSTCHFYRKLSYKNRAIQAAAGSRNREGRTVFFYLSYCFLLQVEAVVLLLLLLLLPPLSPDAVRILVG